MESLHAFTCMPCLPLFNAKLGLRISRLACTQVTPCYSEYPELSNVNNSGVSHLITGGLTPRCVATFKVTGMKRTVPFF